MSTTSTQEGFPPPTHLDRLREMIPHFTRAGLLRRISRPDGGVEFVETQTDRVFAAFDGRGRFVA